MYTGLEGGTAMKKTFLPGLSLAALLAAGGLRPAPCQGPAPAPPGTPVRPIAIVIHGGSGDVLRTTITPEEDAAYRRTLTQALEAGYAVLEEDGSSLDAVVATLRILEDSPLFNAGKGAVFTSSGRIQLDAAIMDGATLKAGAVASVEHVRNPIALARLVMERSPHVLLVGPGAEEFAVAQGAALVPQSYFKTPKRFDSLEKKWRQERVPWVTPEASKSHGTVGCVALDRQGHLAAGTSTGGLTGKLDGRVGDSPIIGAGTYCDDATCGVSCTGTGEFFMRYLVAYDLAQQMRSKGMGVEEAAGYEVGDRLLKAGGPDSGGLIAMDRQGHIAAPFNTKGMFRGWIGPSGKLAVALYGDEHPEKQGS
jgi:beta-aspartyl-peptidase (threonine type)